MRVVKLVIKNFRGIKSADILLPTHGVLIGDNNVGKTTILEALDLVLGPDRLNRTSVIDEHDFYDGEYIKKSQSEELIDGEQKDKETPDSEKPKIEIEATIIDLTDEQKGWFMDYIDFLNSNDNTIYEYSENHDSSITDQENMFEAIRVTFEGWYDDEIDDFEAKTYFTRSLEEDVKPTLFTRKHKQVCGFLYLRSIRTGNRALSLERGSLLDIILRLYNVRPQMWEEIINRLDEVSIFEKGDDKGISGILESISASFDRYAPKEWSIDPHLKISKLTREHLKQVIIAFITTGGGKHSAPFYSQGAGTINMIVLAMLSKIASEKKNVIFAMEEPETAIPPYVQRRIVYQIRKLAPQSLFTSHSPYILEEFTTKETVLLNSKEKEIVLSNREGKEEVLLNRQEKGIVLLDRQKNGILSRKEIVVPVGIKMKKYQRNFRTLFCEGLLSSRVLIVEGLSDAMVLPEIIRHLADSQPDKYHPLELMGICVIDANGEGDIPALAQFYKDIGKEVIVVCDKQEKDNELKIKEYTDLFLMHDEKGIEDLVINGATDEALERYDNKFDWSSYTGKHIDEKDIKKKLKQLFCNNKGERFLLNLLLLQCKEYEIPEWLAKVVGDIMEKYAEDLITSH